MLLGFDIREAASIGIIGGADGPTAIYLTMKMAPHLLGRHRRSSIQLHVPGASDSASFHEVMLTTDKEKKLVMKQLRPVSHFRKSCIPRTELHRYQSCCYPL
jgi:Na+-transporting methylmalonyl-CoA/oxaloacetate decarboxylase beta subunit